MPAFASAAASSAEQPASIHAVGQHGDSSVHCHSSVPLHSVRAWCNQVKQCFLITDVYLVRRLKKQCCTSCLKYKKGSKAAQPGSLVCCSCDRSSGHRGHQVGHAMTESKKNQIKASNTRYTIRSQSEQINANQNSNTAYTDV